MFRVVLSSQSVISRLRKRSDAASCAKSMRLLSSQSFIKDDLKYCVELVQKRDFDAYICGLLIPGDKAKMVYFTARAFNVEIGTALQDTNTNDNTLGVQLRLQFWRDAIEKVYDDGSDASLYESPILRALKHVRASTNMSKILLKRLIDAREMDLDLVANASERGDKIVYSSIAEIEQIGELTSSSLLYMALEGANVIENTEADIAASHLGQSLGIVNILKGAVFRAARGEICIPGDLIEKYSVSESDITQHPLFQENNDKNSSVGCSSAAVKAATKELVLSSRNHLSYVRNMQGDLPKDARPCLLQAVTALHYLDNLEKTDFDIFDAQMLNRHSSRNDFNHHLKLGRAWFTGVF